jgi:AraC-like DNA-binding protein
VSCSVVSETSLLELLLLGKVAIGTRTPREALTRIARALRYFCTHEHLTITPTEEGISVRHFFAVKFDANTLHLIHQYVAFMLQTLCNMTGIADPLVRRIEMSPHPEHGLRHLQRWFGNNLVATKNRTLTLLVDNHVVDEPFPTQGRDRMAGLLSRDLVPLQGDGTYSGSVQILIAAMLGDGRPTLERISAAAGTSVRTLQRRLDAEGASFSALLDSVRRSRALELLAERNTAIGVVSAELGYSRQASLTRAVRRWTGRSPRLLKSESG